MQAPANMIPIVIDTAFNRVCMVDDCISFIWSTRYNNIGDFQITVNVLSPNRQFLQPGNYIARDGIGEVGIIETIAISNDVDNHEVLTVSGRFLSSILARRIIATQTQVSGQVGDCIKKLINENAISPSVAARKIPGLQYGTFSVPSQTMQQQFTGKVLLDAITDICTQFQIGYRTVLTDNNKFSFELYQGVNRSYSQTTNPYVVFSNEYDNLESADYAENYQEKVTDVLVAGEGEGTARKMIWASKQTNSGLARYEMFQDARNASTNDGEISDSVYLAQLKEEGLESISTFTQAFAGGVFLGNIQLGVDFSIGDICTIENTRWQVSANARLLEIIESIDENGVYEVTPTFDLNEDA